MLFSTDLPQQPTNLVGAIRRNRLLISIVAFHALCAAAIGFYVGESFWTSTAPKILSVFSTLSMFLIANYFLWRLAVAVFVIKPDKPIHWMVRDLRSTISDKTKTADFLACFLSVLVLVLTFSYLKDKIPDVTSYSWDPLFAQLDRVLHGGHDVWTLLWPVLGSPYVTTVINAAYNGWFVLIYMAVCLACIDRRDPDRSMVFLVAFALSWSVGGNLLAMIFASVGPVYFEAFGFGDTYAPQIELLRQSHEISPVWALEWHQLLYDGHFNDGPVKGISAMPSMHVSSSVLLALYGFTYSRWLGAALTVFATVILLGSVHLAWHYAIDGYASIVLALALWWLSKKLTKRFGPST